MEIVVEYVFLQNLLIDLIIFKTTEKVLRVKGRHIFLVSAFASVCSIVFTLFTLASVWEFIVKILFGACLTLLAFKFTKFKSFIKIYLAFLFSTFIYGGVCAFIYQTFGALGTFCILFLVVFAYFIFSMLTKTANRRKDIEKFCYDVVIKNGDKKYSFTALLDTGNLAVDPMTGQPINIVSLKMFEKIFCGVSFQELLLKKVDLKKFNLGHYVKIDTAGSGCELLIFQLDNMEIVGKKLLDKPIFGLTLKNFSMYDLIMPASLFG